MKKALKFKSKRLTPVIVKSSQSEPRKIWIDGYEANVPQRLGSSQVAFELIKHLEQLDHFNDYTVLLPHTQMADMPKPRPNWQYQILKPNKLLTYIALPWHYFKSKTKPDIFFSATHYSPRFIRVKRVMTVFDLSYLKFPQYFLKTDLWKLKNWTAYSVKKAIRVVTISQSTKRDIQHFYHTGNSKVVVAYPGFDSSVFRPITNQPKIAETLAKYQIEGQYIIFIGTLQPRKNLERLIEAVSRIKDLKLVIVGKTTGPGRQGWLFQQILDKPAELGIENRVIFTGFAPTEDLPYLIAGSRAYCLVSLYEGFGIPVLEALACGIPAIVSDVSSLPEVVGEAGLLVNPKSVDQIELAIRTLLTDQKLWTKLSKQALIQVNKFSWNKMAKQVLKVLETV